MTSGNFWRNHYQRVREENARRDAGLDLAYLEALKFLQEKEVNENDED